MDTWAVSTFWLLSIPLLKTLTYSYLFELLFSILLGYPLRSGILRHTATLFRLWRLPYAVLFFALTYLYLLSGSSTNFLTSDGYITTGSSAFHTDVIISHSSAHMSLMNTEANSAINRQV